MKAQQGTGHPQTKSNPSMDTLSADHDLALPNLKNCEKIKCLVAFCDGAQAD